MYLRRLIKAKQQSQLSWQNSDLLKKIKQSANPSSVSRFHIKIVTAVLDIRRNPLKLLCPPVQVNAGLGRQTPSVAQPARSSMSQSSSRAGSHQGHIIIQKKTDCSEAVPGWQGEEKDKHCKERSIKGRRPETASALRKSIERGTVEASLKPQGEKKSTSYHSSCLCKWPHVFQTTRTTPNMAYLAPLKISLPRQNYFQVQNTSYSQLARKEPLISALKAT